MTAARPTVFHWSGGKDSAQALGRLLLDPAYDVVRLVTTTSRATGRSTVHGTPPHLLHAQADRIGLPLEVIELPGKDLDGYLAAMESHARTLVAEGVQAVAFGDLTVSQARPLKEAQFGPHGLHVLEPLDGLSSAEVMASLLTSGIEARCVVVDADRLDRDRLGRPVDEDFLAQLPAGVDPAGELGEYHSFVVDAPWFTAPIPLETGEPVLIESVVGTTSGPRTYQWWALPTWLSGVPEPPVHR